MAINKEDILEALGIGAPTQGQWWMPLLIGFGVGALAGTAITLLVAPKSGAEMRGHLFARGRSVIGRSREMAAGKTAESHNGPTP